MTQATTSNDAAGRRDRGQVDRRDVDTGEAGVAAGGDGDHAGGDVGDQHRAGGAGELRPGCAEDPGAGSQLEHPIAGLYRDAVDQRCRRGVREDVDGIDMGIPRLGHRAPDTYGIADARLDLGSRDVRHDVLLFRYTVH